MSSRARQEIAYGRQRHGFTILELLVAGAITVLIAALGIGVLSSSLTQWSRSAGLLTADAQARQVFDLLTRDLEGACLRSDGNVWIAATIQPGAGISGAWVEGRKPVATSLDPATSNLVDARFGDAAVWLRMITSAQAGNGASNGSPMPAAIAYQLIRRPPTPSATACQYALYRAEVTAGATFEVGYNLIGGGYDTPSDIEGTPGSVKSPGFSQLIANHVVDFGVRGYVYGRDPADGTLILQPLFPSSAGDLEYDAQEAPADDDARHRFPAVVDVMLRVLTAEGARLIAALEAGQIVGDWWEMATSHSVVFTRRIRLAAEPL